MLKEITMPMIEWFINYGSLGLFILSFIESSFFPIPPDFVLITLCIANPGLSFVYAGICTLGSVFGGGLGYIIGKFGGRPLAIKFFSQAKIDLAENYYNRWGVLAVGVAGFTPIPYKVFTITSGLFELNAFKFMVVSFFSRGARFFIVSTLLYFFGQEVKVLLMSHFNTISLLSILLLFGGFGIVHVLVKRKRKVVK